MDTVEKFMYRLPQGQQEFVLHIRNLVLNSHPEMTEKLTFGTPFFSLRTWLCYFHPLESGGLEIGFCKGYLMDDSANKLLARGRKVVRSLVYKMPEDFDEKIFKEILQEAVNVQTRKISKAKKTS